MPIPFLPRAYRRLLLPALLLTPAPAALAQYPTGATVQPLPRPGDPAELLAQALRTLAVEPNSLAALTAAGHNALVLGDPNAAVGFFGRAQEIAPRDGRVKAGLGSALVELEKPQDALRLFAEASRLGVPDDEMAEDRGLAYDLTGDPRKAQRDYAAVLAAHPEDDVVRRRLALSQGISGDKAAAIATLDPLIRKRDIAGWRAQTFVLAMNGDAQGASSITHIMLPQQAEMLQPFLVRLATLSPADKARAVNFGEMPAAGRAYTPGELANTGVAPTYAVPIRGARPIPAPRIAPAPQVVTRTSDLAPLPATTASMATASTITAAPARRVTMAPSAAPLAEMALTPAPASPPQTATQAVPTPKPAASPVVVAQASPLYAMASGPPAPDLPTPAAIGHYDLPHDALAHAIPRSEATVAAPPVVAKPSVASAAPQAVRTIGTPVVHEPKRKVLVAASIPPAKPVVDDDAPPSTKSRHGAKASTPDTGKDDATGTTTRKSAHGARLAAPDEGDDTPTTRKSRKGSRDDGAAAKDDGADAASVRTGRRGSHDKGGAAEAGDDGAAKSRKDRHRTKLADADADADKTRKGAHDKKTAGDDDDAKSSRSEAKDAKSERVFVQVAGGANKDDMDKAWAGVKKKAPELMKGRTPQTAPIHATNRLLVGPFKSEDEAQAFVNKMAGKGLSGFTVKSGKGEKIEKVDSGQ